MKVLKQVGSIEVYSVKDSKIQFVRMVGTKTLWRGSILPIDYFNKK